MARIPTAHLRRQAKALLAHINRSDADACARFRAIYPTPTAPTLMRAQHVVAQENGYDKWADALGEHPLRGLVTVDGLSDPLGSPLTIVTGRSGSGKSVSVGCLAVQACCRGRHVAYLGRPDGGVHWAGSVLKSSGLPVGTWSICDVDVTQAPSACVRQVLDHARSIGDQLTTSRSRGLVVIEELWGLHGVDWPALLQRVRSVADIVFVAQYAADVQEARIDTVFAAVPWRWMALQASSDADSELFRIMTGTHSDGPSASTTQHGVCAEAVVAGADRRTKRIRLGLNAAAEWVFPSSAEAVVRLRTARSEHPEMSPWQIVEQLAR